MELMTPEQLAAVEDSVLRMEELAGAGVNFVEADAEFHRLLFEPLNNVLLVNLLGVFWQVYRRLHLELGAAEPGGTEGLDLLETAALHRGIYDAVASGDKALAAQRINGHFDGIRLRISRAVSPQQPGVTPAPGSGWRLRS